MPTRSAPSTDFADMYSLVDVPEELADGIVVDICTASLPGQKKAIRRDRDSTR